MVRVAIFHPTDPLGHVPGGIDAIIRGFLKKAPADVQYTLFGATSDAAARPMGVAVESVFGNPNARFVPLTVADPSARRGLLPLTVRYLMALRQLIKAGGCQGFDVLDFHRIEPLLLFKGDRRPRNIAIHQDMTVIRQKDCDILWRHAPWLYERLEGYLLADLAHLYCVRRSAVQRYVEHYPGLVGRVSFLPTWVDSTVFGAPSPHERVEAQKALHRRLGLREGESARVVVTVGRLDRQKDPLLMLAAFAALAGESPDLRLAFVGDGVLHNELVDAIERSGLSARVTLLGVQPPHSISAILRGSDVFAMSSAYEGMPIAVLEALASGLPVVSTDVGEISTVIRPDGSGAIAAERTPASLAAAMQRVLQDGFTAPRAESIAAVDSFRDVSILNGLFERHRSQAG